MHLAAANLGRIFARKGSVSLQARRMSTQCSPLSHGYAPFFFFFSSLTLSLEVGSGAASYLELLPWERGPFGLSQLQNLAE